MAGWLEGHPGTLRYAPRRLAGPTFTVILDTIAADSYTSHTQRNRSEDLNAMPRWIQKSGI